MPTRRMILGLVGAAGLLFAAAAPSLGAVTIHVSPRGDDRWSGRLAEPNAAKTDGPLASLPAALKAARAARPAGDPTAMLLVREGVYELTQTLDLKPEDSG